MNVQNCARRLRVDVAAEHHAPVALPPGFPGGAKRKTFMVCAGEFRKYHLQPSPSAADVPPARPLLADDARI